MTRLFFACFLAVMAFFHFPTFSHLAPGSNPVFSEKGAGERCLNELRKGPLIINFWASWCRYCVDELPSLDRLSLKMRQQGGDVWVILVEPGMERGNQIFQEKGIQHLKLYHDHKGEVAKAFQALGGGLPLTVFLDADGKEVSRHRGYVDWDSSDAFVKIQNCLGLKL